MGRSLVYLTTAVCLSVIVWWLLSVVNHFVI